jgi:glycosyltransferase involved in cell wall biosynthesis
MKLALVGSYPLDINRITGGVEAVTVYLIEGLKTIQGLDIEVVSLRDGIDSELTTNADGVIVHYIPFAKRFGHVTLNHSDRLRIRKKLHEVTPDIVHSQIQTYNSIAALQSGYPTVVTVHGIIYRDFKLKPGFKNLVRGVFASYIEKWCLRKATHLISINPYVESEFGTLTTAKVYSIPNPVSSRYFDLTSAEISNTLLFLGGITKLKNIMSLLVSVHALKTAFPDIKLRIAGHVDEPHYFDQLKTYIESHDLKDNVTFLGQIPEAAILDEYQRCSVLVLPSFQENSPMVIQQAMAAGKAVVASRVGGIPHLVDDGDTGLLVECDDTQAMTQKIEMLLTDPDWRNSIGQNAKEKATREFRPETVAEKTYDVYRQILAEYKR